MYTLKDYLEFRGDLSFDTSPVNEIDEMVFASMGKADFTGILQEGEAGSCSGVFAEFFSRHDEKEEKSLGLLESPVLLKTLRAVSRSPRYADTRICCFVNKVSVQKTEQLSALTVLGPNGKTYVTFRGTDDTLTGWKENFELSVFDSVPAQRDAVEYLETVARTYAGPLVVSGHSKGGNLAVYAAANACEAVQERIEKVISYDGPGFRREFFEMPGYAGIRPRIRTLVPRNSIVGMLMEYAGAQDVIECEKDGPGAHDIFFWNLDAKGFVRAAELSEKSKVFHQAFDQTLNELDMTERQALINEIFEVLSSTGAMTLTDLTEHTAAQALKLSAKFQRSKKLREFLLLLSRFTIKDAMSSTLEELLEKAKP